ncbi:SID1 transmembrane family member 1-like isoform X2 [Halichondria panicea]
MDHPVLVTVRQCKGVTSWSVPFVESGIAYPWVYRILCPFLSSSEESGILVDLSTSSSRSVNITLRIDIVKHYRLQLHKPDELYASPSSPSYLLFEYPPDLNDVRVKITSDDDTRDICAIASIQNVYCPVVELMDNPQDRGKFQTMRSLAVFNVEKHYHGSPYNFFYVVLSVFPNNGRQGDCDYGNYYGYNKLNLLNQTTHNYDPVLYTGPSRIKHVTVTVETVLSGEEYKIAIVLALALLLTFYVVSFAWITVFDWWRFDLHPVYNALKRQASTLVEEVITPFDDYDSTLAAPRSPTQGEPDTVIGVRPTLLAVLAGVHWKRLAKKAATLETSTVSQSPASPLASPSNQSTPLLRQRQLLDAELPPKDSAGSPLRPTSINSDEDSQSTVPDCIHCDDDDDESSPVSYKHDDGPFPVNVLMSELGKLDEHQSTFDYYPVYVFVVGTFYALPVYQLLVTLRYIMASGNEDICYHNFLCSQPSKLWGLPLTAVNNMFSNIAFFLLGLLVILITYRRRQLYYCYVVVNKRRPVRQRIGVPQNFGIIYAFGMAMMGQAIMSTAYHMCPSRDSFKFDATFMYIQLGLGIHKLIQSRNPDWIPNLHYIMLVLTTLMVTVVIGSIFSYSPIFWWLFWLGYVLSSLVFAVEVYYRWQIPLNKEGVRKLIHLYSSRGVLPPRHKPKFVLAVLTIAVNWSLAFTGFNFQTQKFALFILLVLICNVLLHITYYAAAKAVFRETKCWPPSKVFVFTVLTLLCWAAGLLVFTLETIDWGVSAAVSRDQNSECMLLGFYGAHDIWHFLSAFATFFFCMLLLTMDDRQEVLTRNKIMTF